jgi:hypothetical protein
MLFAAYELMLFAAYELMLFAAQYSPSRSSCTVLAITLFLHSTRHHALPSRSSCTVLAITLFHHALPASFPRAGWA